MLRLLMAKGLLRFLLFYLFILSGSYHNAQFFSSYVWYLCERETEKKEERKGEREWGDKGRKGKKSYTVKKKEGKREYG